MIPSARLPSRRDEEEAGTDGDGRYDSVRQLYHTSLAIDVSATAPNYLMPASTPVTKHVICTSRHTILWSTEQKEGIDLHLSTNPH
jgi:hypothetical protein